MAKLENEYDRLDELRLDVETDICAGKENIARIENKIEALKNDLADHKNVVNVKKRQLEKVIADKRDVQQRIMRSKNEAARRKANAIMKQYNIVIENESYREYGEYVFSVWVGKPEWLKRDDPLEDGHFAHDWHEVLWLVDFYAKWHPDHPDHEKRQVLKIAPHA